MRIAIVSDYFPDFVGGAQTSMREQRLALQAAGHHVVMVSAVRGGSGGRFRRTDDGLQVKPSFTLPGVELPVIPNNDGTTKVLEEFLREHKIDVVHVQTEFGLAHAAATVAARMGIPVVHTVHTLYWASDGGWHAPLEPLIRALLRRVIRWQIPRQPFTPRPVDNLLRNLTLRDGEARGCRGVAVRAPGERSASGRSCRTGARRTQPDHHVAGAVATAG